MFLWLRSQATSVSRFSVWPSQANPLCPDGAKAKEQRQHSECCGTQPQHPRQLTTFTTAAASATQPTRSDNVLTIS